jgi:small GTP-binding protein
MAGQRKEPPPPQGRRKSKIPNWKILFLGDSGTGKTCLLLRYVKGQFTATHRATIGMDHTLLETEVEGQPVRLQLWDTAGQDRFRAIITSYYRGAHGVMIVYDITSATSFHSVRHWMQSIDEYAHEKTVKILVGNKSDLSDQRVISPEKGRELAEEYGIPFFETSALSGSRINEAFEALALKIKRSVLDSVSGEEEKAKPLASAPSHPSSCCT